MREICKAIIDGGAEVSGVAGTSLPCNLNMVAIQGIEPTQEEANVLMRAAEDYCRTVRAIVHGWVARLPQREYNRRAEDTGGGESA